MRNLKKSLAFVMAFALVFATVASAATFTDVPSTYSYSEEVELLADLGVLVGVDGSSFQPDATLTRVQAAAVIFRCLTGRTSADMYAGATKFWDVNASYWGTGYINFCSNAGAIGGYPDGSFKPDQPVTVAEFESMLVRALGLTEGKNLAYPNGYLAIADANLINDGVASIGAGSPASRGLVAKLAYNAICNATYQTIATSDKPSPKIIEEIFKITPITAYIVSAGKSTLGTAPYATDSSHSTYGATAQSTGKFEYVVKGSDGYYDGYVLKSEKVDASMLGQKVKIYKKTSGSDTDKAFAVVTSTDNKVVALKNEQLFKTSDSPNKYYYKDADGNKQYVTFTSTGYMLNGIYTADTIAATTMYVNTSTLDTSGKAGDRVLKEITLVSNDGSNGSIEYAFVKDYAYAEFDGIYNNRLYFLTPDDLSAAGTAQVPSYVSLKVDNTTYPVTYPSSLANGDPVLVYKDASSSEAHAAEIIACNTVTGEFTAISGSGFGGTYTIGGTAYKLGGYYNGSATAELTTNVPTATDLSDSFTGVVAAKFGYLLNLSEVSADIPNYFYVTGSEVSTNFGSTSYKVQGYKTDGTKVEYTIDKPTFTGSAGAWTATPPADVAALYTAAFTFNGSATAVEDTYSEKTVHAVFTVTVNSSNKITKAVAPTAYSAPTGALAKDAYNATSSLLSYTAGGTYKVNQNSVFFFDKYMDGDTVKVYIGTFPQVAASNEVMQLYTTNDSLKIAKVGVMKGAAKGASSSLENILGMPVGDYSTTRTSDDKYIISFSIVTQGEKKTLSTTPIESGDISTVMTNWKKGALIEYDLTVDGNIAVDGSSTFAMLYNDKANQAFDPYGSGIATTDGDLLAAAFVKGKSTNVITANSTALNNTGTSEYYTISNDVKVYEIDTTTYGNSDKASMSAVVVTPGSSDDNYKKAYFVFDQDATDIAKATVVEIYFFK